MMILVNGRVAVENKHLQLLHKKDFGVLGLCAVNGIVEVFCPICQERWQFPDEFKLKFPPGDIVEWRGTDTSGVRELPPQMKEKK